MFVNQKSIKTLTQGIVTRQSEPHQSIDCFYSGQGPQRKSNQSIKRVNQRGRFRPELINQHKYINQVIINHVFQLLECSFDCHKYSRVFGLNFISIMLGGFAKQIINQN